MEKDVYDPERANELIKESFDFSTSVSCPVQLSVGRKTLVRIYADNPEKGGNPKQLYAAYTDKSGLYNGKITLPGEYIGKTVYACAYGICIPATVSVTGMKFTNADNHPQTRGLEVDKELCERLKDEFMSRLNENTDHTQEVEGQGDINLNITEDNTEVLISFIYSGASIGSRIYYYYYPTGYAENNGGEHPGSRNYFYNPDKKYGDFELIANRFKNDKFLLFAHEGVDHNGFLNNGCNNDFIGISQHLKFYGEKGTDEEGKDFPKGYSIGLFIQSTWADRFRPLFTDTWCNSYRNNDYEAWVHNNRQAGRFKDSESGKIIYGFEDLPLNLNDGHLCDKDYNDFLFVISTDFSNIEEGNIPELSDDITERHEGTLLYEDLYPSEGDYDMNDVIIEYTWTKHFNSKNELIKIDYEFTPTHNGASLTSDFSLMIDGFVNNPIEIFKDHKSVIGQTFTGSITEGVAGKQKDDISWNDFNPFITIEKNGREVHLTKKRASIHANQEGLNEYQKNYVSFNKNKAGEYPFAMDIARKGFTPVKESQRIERNYPQYKQWVETEGKECADWYNHYTDTEQ